MLAEEIVLQTATAAFARRADGTITAWNEAAEDLLLMSAERVEGRKCHDVIAGCDVFGNEFCCELCACSRMATQELPIHPYRLGVKDSFGRSLEVRVSILVARGREGNELVHLLEPMTSRVLFTAVPDDLEIPLPSGTAGAEELTRRELEVLRLLAVGWSTDDIAERLMISPTTVRNHVARCLQKLDVHSRLEAVHVARRLDLV